MGGGRVIRALTLAAALVATAGVASAGAGAVPASIRTYDLKLGDIVVVKGAPIQCVVQRNRGVLNLTCVKGTLASPVRHSYAVGIADRAADLATITAGAARLDTLVSEPALHGPLFAVRPGSPRRFTIAPVAALLVGGTHIFCAIDRATGSINVTCGLSTLALRLQFPPGSFITSISSAFALIDKAERR